MKALTLILLFITSEAFAVGSTCGRLQDIVRDYELMIQRKKDTSCNTLAYTDITSPNEELRNRVMDEMKCAPLSAFEERARTLENKLTLLAGFQILKNEIRTNKEATAQNNLTKAQRAARDFQKSLQTAQTLDLLINTANAENQPHILTQLKEMPEERRNTPEKLRNEILNLCRGRAREAGAQDSCSQRFSPSVDTVRELNSVLQGTVDNQQIESWRNALRIQKSDGSAYSFTEMYQDLREALPKISNGRLTLNRNELNTIKNLPNFQDVAALPFMNALKDVKSGIAIHTSLEKFKFTTGDLKARQEAETKSKVSWLWQEIGNSGIVLDADNQAACAQSRSDFAQARACWSAISAARESIPQGAADKKETLIKIASGLDASLSYYDQFPAIEMCLNPQSGPTALSTANTGDELSGCSVLNNLNTDVESLQQELLVINGMRERIGNQNQRDMKFRNFAIQKLSSMNCAGMNRSLSSVECETHGLNKVAPEAYELASSVLNMSIMQISSAEISVEDECESSRAGGQEGDLCSYYAQAPANPNVPQTQRDTDDSAYVEVSNPRNLQREAVRDGLAGIATGIATQLLNPPRNYYNPYQYVNPFPYNYNPYPYTGAMSPADSILFNQRYYGAYGMYFPTVGAAPYTAFPVNSPYMQTGALTSSSYFGAFGTYK